MEQLHRTRRRFVQGGIAALSGVLLWRFLTPAPPAIKRGLRVARSEIPAEGALVFRRARVALMQEGGEIYALSLTCTHLGCTVGVTPEGLVCPCHGSAFGRGGEVLRGPATRPLQRLAVHLEAEHVVVEG